MRRAFTLIELLMVIAIIGILSAMTLLALAGAAEEGRRQRAKSLITKLDQLISEKWNSYRYRRTEIQLSSGIPPAIAAQRRLYALREFQRMEMPDRLNDVLDDPAANPGYQPNPAAPNYDPRVYFYIESRPSLSQRYLQKVKSAMPAPANTLSYDQAEMLYLIISEMRDGDRSALNFLLPSEVGDLDADGLSEILDPWGTPVMFLRWAPGYSKFTVNDAELAGKLPPPYPQLDTAVSTFQQPHGELAPDPNDPLKSDFRWQPGSVFKPFLLRPLIFSAGPDKVYDIYIDPGTSTFHYNATTPPNDPYAYVVDPTGNKWMGMPADANNDGLQHGDNVTNHGLELEGE